MDDSDILNFGHTKKISFKAALRDVQSSRPSYSTVVSSPESSNTQSDFSEEEERRYVGYKRRHNLGGREGSLASQLIHGQVVVLSSEDSDDEDSSFGLGKKKKAKKRVPSPPVLSDSSRSPSPEPSPPVVGSFDTPTDKTSKRVLNKASDALNQLMYSTYSTPGSESYSDLAINDSLVGSATKETITIRVRYRGKIRKYTISKCDPLSLVCSLLASEVKEKGSSQFLLSHKTSTLSETDTPLSLGLTTADIIDAIQMSDSTSASAADVGGSPTGGSNQVKIKIQTSKKSINYSISRTDPLKKAMDAFAKEMGVSVKKLTFSFDGDRINPKQTAEDFEMEDGDCIDARL